ncbi:MAG: DUF1592 domain-containing protein [Polyangiales bacterium]
MIRRPLAILLLVLSACTGQIGEVDEFNPGIDPFNPPPGYCEETGPMLGVVPIRRLSRVEYRNAVRDLLPGVAYSPPALPNDAPDHGFENASRNLSAPLVLVEQHQSIAEAIAEAAVGNPATMQALLGCASWVTPGEQSACTASFVNGFGLRAFRRPLSGEERATYTAFVEDMTAAVDYEAGIELALAAFLQAPQFMYRVELGESGVVTPFEMASRLSFLLWQSIPDSVLLEAAASGRLSSAEDIEAQARRMIAMPQAREAMVDFHRQWLGFDAILEPEHLGKDRTTYPDWDPALIISMREEADRFVEHVMFEEGGTIEALMTSRTSFVDSRLASLYGLSPVSDWMQVELPAGERSGILTRANFLAAQAHGLTGSPILRGVFVNERLLCVSFGALPDNADTSEPEPEPGAGPQTNRMAFEARTAPDECQVCHTRIDGIGFAFENYDASGAFRDIDNTLPVDASGELINTDVDGEVVGAVELSEQIATSQTLSDCVARNWVRYTLGRAAQSEDACFVQTARDSLASNGGDVRELLIDLVTSPDFARGLQ